MPAVLPPSGSGPSSSGDPERNKTTLSTPPLVEGVIFENDSDYKTVFSQKLNFADALSFQQVIDKRDSSDPYDLSKHFFHFIEALPLISNRVDFSEAKNEFEFFNSLKHFLGQGFPKDTFFSDKRTYLATIYQLLKTKAKPNLKPELSKLLEKAVNLVANNLYHVSLPSNINLTGAEPYNAKKYLEDKLLDISIKETNPGVKRELSKLLGAVSSEQGFTSLLNNVHAHALSLEEARLGLSDYNYSQSLFQASKDLDLAGKVRSSFDRIVSATELFIDSTDNKYGANGSFKSILREELNSDHHEDDVSVNFHESLNNVEDPDLIEKQVDLTFSVMDDLISMGYQYFGFAGFLREYCFDDFAGLLNLDSIHTTATAQDLVYKFLSPDNKSRDFQNYAQLGKIAEGEEYRYPRIFIDFIDKLKSRILDKRKPIHIDIFPIDNGDSLNQWAVPEGEKRVYFNNNYYEKQPTDTYNLCLNIFQFDPGSFHITDEDLESCCTSASWNENGVETPELNVAEALPLVITDLQGRVSNGDAYTLADLDSWKSFIRDGFEVEDPQNKPEFHDGEAYSFVMPDFARFDTELEPDLYKIVFVKGNDGDDDDGDIFDTSPAPEGSLILS